MTRHKFDKNFIKLVNSQIHENVCEKQDRIALTALSRLTAATPVDTGQAAASWNLALNERDLSAPDKNGDSYVVKILAKGNKKARRIGDTYFLVNVAKHIVYLNEGSSSRAPTKFVESEVLAAVKDVEKGE